MNNNITNQKEIKEILEKDYEFLGFSRIDGRAMFKINTNELGYLNKHLNLELVRQMSYYFQLINSPNYPYLPPYPSSNNFEIIKVIELKSSYMPLMKMREEKLKRIFGET